MAGRGIIIAIDGVIGAGKSTCTGVDAMASCVSGATTCEQAMEGLAETLRDQQGLSDEAFRDLQEQFGKT